MSTVSHYDNELSQLSLTFDLAKSADITPLKAAIAAASESSLFGVGSGGSYTIAALLCSLHEAYTGRVSRPSTPLELICNPTLASSSPVFLISAEGKNPDIVEALQRARNDSARTIHVLTNRENSILTEKIESLTNINVYMFPLADKDGYLATNSMLMDAILVARSYSELESDTNEIPHALSEIRLASGPIDTWLASARSFVELAITRPGIIVVYSPQLQAIAADLESKLSESAISFCQLADIRSFAHGRHLWCAKRPEDCAILVLTEPTLEGLWNHMEMLLPDSIPILRLSLSGSGPWDLIAGLIAQMHLVSELAKCLNFDPGKPKIQQFGRDLYYTNLRDFIPAIENNKSIEESKLNAIGCNWPSRPQSGGFKRSGKAFLETIKNAKFQSVIFDYDGTLCSSQRKDKPPSAEVVKKLIWLAENNIIVGIASGRGGSIQNFLKDLLPQELWPKFILGLYNGGCISNVGAEIEKERKTSEYLSHSSRIIKKLEKLGVPIEKIRCTQPYQISVRFREGISTEDMWFVLADAHRQAGLDLSRMVCSKHSIDILGENVGKYKLLSYIIHEHKIHPYKVVTIGDQGAWPGNDAALLEHRYSLSVDIPSRRLDRGWKLSPQNKRDVDATMWYLDRVIITETGEMQFEFD